MDEVLFGNCRDAVAAECVAVSLDEYYEIVCKDPLDFMKAVHVAANGNDSFTATSWAPVPELQDDVCQTDISYRIPLAGVPYVSLGDAVVQQQTQLLRTPSLIALRLVTRMPPSLKGDCFEVVVVIRAQQTSEAHRCMVSVTGQVNFLASTWFQSLIEANAVKGYNAFYPFWLRELQKRIEAWRATHPIAREPALAAGPLTPTRASASASDAASSGRSAHQKRRKASGLLVLFERPKACESLIVRAASSGPLSRRITPSSSMDGMAAMAELHDAVDANTLLSSSLRTAVSAEVEQGAVAQAHAQALLPRTERSMTKSHVVVREASDGGRSTWTSALLHLLQPVTDAFKALGDAWSAPKLFTTQSTIVQDLVSAATAPAAAAIASLARASEPAAAVAGAIAKPATRTASPPVDQPAGKPGFFEALLTPRPAIVVAFAMSQVVMAVTYFVYKDAAWA